MPLKADVIGLCLASHEIIHPRHRTCIVLFK